MKQNLKNLQVEEISLVDIIKLLWREKILILSITIICGLAGYLYSSNQAKNYKTEIQLKNPSFSLFEIYNYYVGSNKNIDIYQEFIYDFKSNFLSLNNLQSFTEESREFDNFKEYLKSRNISARDYFKNKIGEEKEKSGKYFLFFTKELDGDIFFYKYAEFIKNKTVLESKKKIKILLENKIANLENTSEKSKIIDLSEIPLMQNIIKEKNQMIYLPLDFFYNGSKVIEQEIYHTRKILIKLENDQFNYDFISQNPLNSLIEARSGYFYFQLGLMLGMFLSLGIIFFKHILRYN